MERKWPIYYERKKETATPKNTSKPKKKGPDCFCFCFCFTPFFSMVKGIKTKRKIKEKEKRSPDLVHYWRDTDSGPGSRPLWPGFWFRVRTRIRIYGSGSGCCLKAQTFRTFCGLLRTFYGLSGLDFYLEDMLMCVCVRGGPASVKIWVKTRKIVGSATLLF